MSILDTIKQLLGISSEDTSFDIDIIIFINTALSVLYQMGIDEAKEVGIIDETTMWEDLIDDRTDLEPLKTYIYFKVKAMFDPPTNTSSREAMDRVIKELEWRITNMLTINKTQEEVKEDE